MATDLHHQIRMIVSQYLAGTITVRKFHDLVMPIIVSTKGTEKREFLADVYRIELLLADLTGGYSTEAEFRDELAESFKNRVVTVHLAPAGTRMYGLSFASASSATNRLWLPTVGTGVAVIELARGLHQTRVAGPPLVPGRQQIQAEWHPGAVVAVEKQLSMA
jgi:hypothetical protein